MKNLIIAAAIISVTSVSALAGGGNDQGGNNNNQGGGYRGAPGPMLGAGAPAIVAGVGYGIYWLRARRRRKD